MHWPARLHCPGAIDAQEAHRPRLGGHVRHGCRFPIAISLAPGAQAATNGRPVPAAAATSVDTTAPSVPTVLTAVNTCGNTVTLQWSPATDNVAVTGYDVYRATGAGFTLIGVSTTTTTTDKINSITQYEVRARDAAGNVSAFSSVVTTYPLGCPVPSPSPTPTSAGDSTPPSVPTGLGYRINCALDFTLTWSASTDNVGVAGYDIYRAVSGSTFASVGTSTTTSFADHLTGVWQYEVRARDFAGNGQRSPRRSASYRRRARPCRPAAHRRRTPSRRRYPARPPPPSAAAWLT